MCVPLAWLLVVTLHQESGGQLIGFRGFAWISYFRMDLKTVGQGLNCQIWGSFAIKDSYWFENEHHTGQASHINSRYRHICNRVCT
jgi:hypothetical protein